MNPAPCTVSPLVRRGHDRGAPSGSAYPSCTWWTPTVQQKQKRRPVRVRVKSFTTPHTSLDAFVAKRKLHDPSNRWLSTKDRAVRYNVKRTRANIEEVLVTAGAEQYRFVVSWTPKTRRLRSVAIDGSVGKIVVKLAKRYLAFATGKCKPPGG